MLIPESTSKNMTRNYFMQHISYYFLSRAIQKITEQEGKSQVYARPQSNLV